MLLTPDFEVAMDQAVAISGNRIVAVGARQDLERRYTAKQVLKGEGKLIAPGLVDAHTHTAQQFLRGRTAEEPPMVWARILVPFESNLDEDDMYASGMLAGVEYIKAGITSFADSGGPHMHRVAAAVDKLGLRACIARSTMDCGDFVPPSMMDSSPAESVRKTEELYQAWNGKDDGRIQIWFALRQAITSTPGLAEAVADAAKRYDTSVHIHLAEHRREVEYCLTNYRMRPTNWFDSFGLVGDRLLAAHCVLLRDDEVMLMHDKGAHPVHCPRANLTNHGFPKLPLFLTLGTTPGIASDGASGNPLDLFSCIRILYSATIAQYGLSVHDSVAVRTKDMLRMATQGGANALRLGSQIGSLTPGKKADLILINMNQPHLNPFGDPVRTIAACAGPADVTDSVIDGRIVMRDRQVLTCDEQEVMALAAERHSKIFARLGI